MGERFVEMQGARKAADLLGDFAGKGMRQAVYKTLERTVRTAQEALEPQMYAAFEDPTKFSLVRPGRRSSSVVPTDIDKSGGDVSIGMKVQDKQAAYFRFHMGEGQQVRTPGEVGVATKSNFVPQINNLYDSGMVTPTDEGNLPRNALASLRARTGSKIGNDRDMAANRLKRAPTDQELAKQTERRKRREAKGKQLKYTGVWFGTLGRATGFWQRLKKADQDVEGHRYRLLVLAVKRSVYRSNRLTEEWNVSVQKAADALPDEYGRQVDKILKLKG